jgi:hypothetical protein
VTGVPWPVIREEERRWRFCGSGVEVEGFLNTEGTEIAEKEKRDFPLRRPTRSHEANVDEKASACSARKDDVGVGLLELDV